MSKKVKIISILIIIGVVLLLVFNRTPEEVEVVSTPVDTIVGCYVATDSKSVYTLQIQNQNGNDVNGVLEFNNFEFDSTSGTFSGRYADDMLTGTYVFQAEGNNSETEMVFKKEEYGFLRGMTEDDMISYDPESPMFVFKKGECVQ